MIQIGDHAGVDRSSHMEVLSRARPEGAVHRSARHHHHVVEQFDQTALDRRERWRSPLGLVFGEIGGILRIGFIGIFIGPLVMAAGYSIVMSWLGDEGGSYESGQESE